MIVEVTRDITKVVVTVASGLPSGRRLKFEWDSGGELYAEALAFLMRVNIEEVVERTFRSLYEEGYRDGQRDARSHRPARKRLAFERRL